MGYIQIGIPVNGIQDIKQLGIEVPNFYIVPTQIFDHKLAFSLIEVQEVCLINYMAGRITYFIGSESSIETIKRLFKLHNQAHTEINQDVMYHSDEYVPRVNQKQEYNYIFDIIQSANAMDFNDCIQYIPYEKMDSFSSQYNKAKVSTELEVVHKDLNIYIYENGMEMACVNDMVYLVEEDQFRDELNSEDVQLILRREQAMKNKVGKSVSRFSQQQSTMQQRDLNSQPPVFGVTFLREESQLSLGFIIWINGHGILVDPPLNYSKYLKKLEIQESLIEQIILTQNNSENDAGIFQRIWSFQSIHIITSEPIINAFILKYSLLTNSNIDLLKNNISFKPIIIGAPLKIRGATFKFFQTFNHMPGLGFEVNYCNKGILFYGDTLVNKQMSSQGFMSPQRINALTQVKWKYYNLFIIYAGSYPWNTQSSYLLDWIPKQYRNQVVLLSRQCVNREQLRSQFEQNKNNTLVLEESYVRPQDFNKIIEFMASVQVFQNISIKNFRDLVQCVKEEKFLENQMILKKGSLGSKFYFVLNGVVKIYSEQSDNSFERYFTSGMYFGETALLDSHEKRMADAMAITQVELLSIEKSDFWFIFGEQKDDAGPILRKLFSLFEARQQQAIKFINMNSVFSQLNTLQKTQLEMILTKNNLKQNQTPWVVGSVPKFAFILIEGHIKYFDCPEEKLPPFDQPGSFFGEFKAISNNERMTTSIIALKESVIFKIMSEDLTEFLKMNLSLFMKFQNNKYLT